MRNTFQVGRTKRAQNASRNNVGIAVAHEAEANSIPAESVDQKYENIFLFHHSSAECVKI